jgi:predicted ATPase/Tfp pilus assembly protein PilF
MQIGDLVAERFRIDAAVASGGMGTVYRALDLRGAGAVAVKTCLPATAESARARARFEVEARALSEISHAGIVGYVDHGTTEQGEPFLAMEWVEGENLAQRLASSGLRAEETFGLGRDLTRALGVIHAHGMVHRDLKPQNVMLRGGDVKQPVLVDFGVARRAEDVSLTLSGARVGTLLYMAPEQIRDPRGVDGSADVFALGCILFECLTGAPTFEADDALATIAQILLDDAPDPRARRPELPESAARLVRLMLARDRGARPAADARLERELEALAAEMGRLQLGSPRRVVPVDAGPTPPATRDAPSDDAGLPSEPLEVQGPVSDGRRRPHVGPINRFVARDAELLHVSALIQSGAELLVLWGPAGIGKTRLAHELMRRAGLGQVELIELGQARDRDDVLRGIIGRVAASVRGRESPEQVVGRALGRFGSGLLVLDRVEHLAHELAPLLEAWRRAAPGLCFLLTSREKVRIDGAVAIELGPLATAGAREPLTDEPLTDEPPSLSAAGSLFAERAGESGARLELGPAQRRAVEGIVQALDGIPLAIELAAARVALLGLEGVASRLTKQGEATMLSALDASIDLLTVSERRAFAQCSAFRAGFAAEAADAVLELGDDAPPVLDVVQSLREKSLLSSMIEAEGDRPRLYLFSVMRQRAALELARAGDEAAVRGRHAAYFVARARELSRLASGKHRAEAEQRIEAESDDLLAAIDYALADATRDVPLALEALVALEPVIGARGPLPAFMHLIDRAIESGEAASLPRPLRSLDRLRVIRARIAATSGRFDAALADLAQVIEHALAEGDPRLEAEAQLELGVAHHLRLALDDARACYERARALLPHHAEPELEGRCLGNLGALLHDAGRLTEAAAYYWRAVRLLEETGEQRMRGNFLNNLGVLEQELGAFKRARRHYREALELLLPAGDDRVSAITLGNLGVLEQECSAWERARRCHERALALFAPLADTYSEALCLARLGATWATLGDVGQAEAHLGRAQRLAVSAEPSRLEAVRLQRAFLELSLARRAFEAGDAEAARARLEQATQRCAQVESLAARSDDIRVTLRILKSLLASASGFERR